MAAVIRTCVGCRQRVPKNELIRVVADGQGGILIDLAGAAPGRGAYLHADCAERANRKGVLSRALRTAANRATRVNESLLLEEK